MWIAANESQVELVGRKQPTGNIFCQQKLKAWQPFFDASYGSLIFFLVGIIFVFIGAGLLHATFNLQEEIVDYTDCVKDNAENCAEKPCLCSINFTLSEPIAGPVFIYYALTNFFKNHRSYSGSISLKQLQGLRMKVEDLGSCHPLISHTKYNLSLQYLPCGLVPNSIYNDTFQLTFQLNASASLRVPLTNSGIAWNSDVDRSYGTIPKDVWPMTIKPPSWPKPANTRSPGAFKSDQELMVWNHRSPLPNFRKLHRRVKHDSPPFLRGLSQGIYHLDIVYNYPVSSFGGRKQLIFANVNWMGGKNEFLGAAFIFDGILNLLIAVYFLVMHKLRRISDYDSETHPNISEGPKHLPQ